MSQSLHFQSVHFLRGIAALLVAGDHLLGRSPYLGWLHDAGDLGVVCFFVISGFAIAHSLGPQYAVSNFPRFFLRRLARIEPAYIASVALYCAYVTVLSRIAPRATPWMPTDTQVLAHLLYLVPFTEGDWFVPAYWTLAVEFQFYLLIGLLYPSLLLVERRSRFGYVLWVILLAALAFASPLCASVELLKYCPYFALGLLLERQVSRPVRPGEFWSAMLSIAAIAYLAESGASASPVCAGVVTVVVVLRWQEDTHVGGRLLRAGLFLGTISYSWYVVHMIVGSVGESAARALLKLESMPWRSHLIDALPAAGFAASILAAWLLYILVERPTHRWARTIAFRPDRRV